MMHMYDQATCSMQASKILRDHPSGQCTVHDGSNFVLPDGARLPRKAARNQARPMSVKEGLNVIREHGTEACGLVVFDPKVALKSESYGKHH